MNHRSLSYLNHWLNEVNSHSLQAPFIYSLYTKYIQKDFNKIQFKSIEETRKRLLESDLKVTPTSYGATSTVHAQNKKVHVSDITKKGLTSPKVSRLLARLIDYNSSKTIVELGTSFGLNTLYLAKIDNSKVITFEASEDIADIALTNFEYFNKTNIDMIMGNIDHTLPKFLDSRISIDFAYLDANHRYEPTINYFNQIIRRMHDDSIVVLDDIYWSKEMTQAWYEIKNHSQVTHSIDLFDVGIVFFKPDLVKTNYRLMF